MSENTSAGPHGCGGTRRGRVVSGPPGGEGEQECGCHPRSFPLSLDLSTGGPAGLSSSTRSPPLPAPQSPRPGPARKTPHRELPGPVLISGCCHAEGLGDHVRLLPSVKGDQVDEQLVEWRPRHVVARRRRRPRCRFLFRRGSRRGYERQGPLGRGAAFDTGENDLFYVAARAPGRDRSARAVPARRPVDRPDGDTDRNPGRDVE